MAMPASFSTKTLLFLDKTLTDFGVKPTLHSLFLISLGTPIIMLANYRLKNVFVHKDF